MAAPNFRKALIVGAGAGLSAALARAFARHGLALALAARSTEDLAPLAQEIGARSFAWVWPAMAKTGVSSTLRRIHTPTPSRISDSRNGMRQPQAIIAS